MGRKPTNAISIYSLISDHDQRYNICIVWTRQMESDDKTVESQREKIDHTCTDRRLHSVSYTHLTLPTSAYV